MCLESVGLLTLLLLLPRASLHQAFGALQRTCWHVLGGMSEDKQQGPHRASGAASRAAVFVRLSPLGSSSPISVPHWPPELL